MDSKGKIKMTLDEAIKHCLEVVERQEKLKESKYISDIEVQYCDKCAANHRQFVEWLTELKELKNSIGTVRLNNMTGALKLIRAYKAENIAQKKMIAEYKRLLKSAANVLNMFMPCDQDYNCSECIKQRQNCDYDDSFKWRYLDEALKLIGCETDEQI